MPDMKAVYLLKSCKMVANWRISVGAIGTKVHHLEVRSDFWKMTFLTKFKVVYLHTIWATELEQVPLNFSGWELYQDLFLTKSERVKEKMPKKCV